jgi:hypothetical protein
MNVVQEISRILEENAVGFGVLRLESLDTSKHHVISDNERVLVKLLRPDNEVLPMIHEVGFAVNTGYGTNPLLEEVFHKSSKGTTLLLSAWEWEDVRPVGRGMSAVQAAQAGRELFKIHSCPKYEGLFAESKDDFIRYGEKLNSFSFTALSAENQNRLRTLFDKVIQPHTELLSLNPMVNVVSHGNPVPEKLFMRQDFSLFWGDYEAARSAPREYDLAHLSVHLTHRLNRPDLWTVVRSEYEALHGRGLNERMLDQFSALLLAQRALLLSSKSSSQEDENKLNGFLKELEPLTKGSSVDTVRNFSFLH